MIHLWILVYLWIRGEHPIHILHSLILDAQSHHPYVQFVTCTIIEVNIICNEWATLTILSNLCHSFSKVKMHVTPIVGVYMFEDFIPTYTITKPTLSLPTSLAKKKWVNWEDTKIPNPWCVPSKTYLTFTKLSIIPSFINTWLLNSTTKNGIPLITHI